MSVNASWLVSDADVNAARALTQGDTAFGINQTQAELFLNAMTRARDAQQEYFRVEGLTSGGEKPTEPTLMSKMEGLSIDYWLAVLSAAANTASTNTMAPFTRQAAVNDPTLSPIFNVYGVETANFFPNPSGVSNSQIHYGTDVGVFIESQPLYRGGIVWSTAAQSALYSDIKLLNSDYRNNDFGDTHSLVLIVDSLAVQNVLKQLAPAVDQATLINIFKQASNLKATQSVLGGQGTAESPRFSWGPVGLSQVAMAA